MSSRPDTPLRKLLRALTRWAALRCPACGGSSIVERPFHIRHHCPACGALFKREAGFFVGAIMANVVTTEFVILACYAVCLPLFGYDSGRVFTALFALAALFPVAFYHHSWGAWLGLDHLVETLPRHAPPRD